MMIFWRAALLAAVAAEAKEIVSPLFLFSSTAALDITPIPDDSSVNEVHHAFYGAISSCPTKNYAVVYQPSVSTEDYASNYLPIGVHAHTNLIVEKIQGSVDVVAVVNTILMDCLHASNGVKRVESLDTSRLEVADLDEELIKKSIMHVSLPKLPVGMGKKGREATLATHDTYIRTMVSKHFNNKDYTLVYITEGLTSEENANIGLIDGDFVSPGAEVPFIFEDEESLYID